ncbi:type III secretion system translocon subunit SctE [Pararobbsia silviterrae]|nr:type III secretion system translocon subunit SctE [Pararobbsia silviterrae]
MSEWTALSTPLRLPAIVSRPAFGALAREAEAQRAPEPAVSAPVDSHPNGIFDIDPRPAYGTIESPAVQLNVLTSRLQVLIDEFVQTHLAQVRVFLSAVAEARREAATAEAKQVADQLQRAQLAATVVGWIGRILAWVLMAVSVVSAVFTGGASLLLAVTLATATVVDQIVQSTTGTSPIATALDAVLKPLVGAIAEVLSAMLESAGVNPETARLVANIIGTIVACVIIVVVAVVGARAATKLLEPICRNLGRGLARALADCTRHVPRMGVRVQQAVTVGTAAEVTFVGAGNVAATVLSNDVLLAQAAFDQLEASGRILSETIAQIFEESANALAMQRETMGIAIDALTQERVTGLHIAKGFYRAV